MKQFKQKIEYNSGNLETIEGISLRMCIKTARRFFALPTVTEIRKNSLQFIVKVSDKPSDEAVKLRIAPEHVNRLTLSEMNLGYNLYDAEIQGENLQETGYHKLCFYYETHRMLINMFCKTNKKYLYVNISEA